MTCFVVASLQDAFVPVESYAPTLARSKSEFRFRSGHANFFATVPQKYFVHENAICESTKIGEGSRVWAFAHVMQDATVGKNCNLGEGVFVENGAVIGDGCTIKNGVAVWDRVVLEANVFVGPNVVFTNVVKPRAFMKRGAEAFLPTRVGTGASLGANCTIVCGVTIGAYAFIGAGTVVVKDVPAHSLVVGNPGSVVARVCFCGERLDDYLFCHACGLPLGENNLEMLLARPTTVPFKDGT